MANPTYRVRYKGLWHRVQFDTAKEKYSLDAVPFGLAKTAFTRLTIH